MNKCGTTYCELRYGHPGSHSFAYVAPEKPTHRIEWFGTLQVHQPVKP